MKSSLKKLIALSIILFCLIFTACGGAKFPAGTYKGTGQGFVGTISAELTLSGKRIEVLTISGPDETPGIGSNAIQQLPDRIVQNNSTKVDLVSGATYTSQGIIEAVNAAFAEAGIDPSLL
ncbi:MAG: FMN-binding protein [Spirochaetales bacterium]|nr:FMN-binding protein [Spirochaetales bacterium]